MYTLRLFSIASVSIALSLIPSVKVYANGEEGEWKVGQIVETTSGRVEGHSSVLVPSVSEYLGIRYAMAATGPLRFAAPQAYKGDTNESPFVANNFVTTPDTSPIHVLAVFQSLTQSRIR